MTLSAAQIGQMSRLLDEALPLDMPSRRGWLEQACPKHRELATALRRCLLPGADERPDPIDLDALPRIDSGQDDPAGADGVFKPNEQVGPYRLMRRLGAGGMAEVWLAQRADGAFRREVALKLPTLSPLRPDLVQRFARECDILAGLEHVNIARMYDAGVRDDGLPYLVMEYVQGEPLIDWCDGHRLPLRERIGLFLQVLDAVQYAHAHRVIHRDLKPSNILVGRDGRVRLLDFGVATLVDEQDPRDAHLTRLYGRALTPAYASLELLRGEPGDAASDVYSLGIVLYELMSGNRPYRVKAGASASQLEHDIATVRIERPSAQLALKAGPARGTTQRELARKLSGNLDAIVLKALSPVRQHRYPSASALADDLRRHLRGGLVQARRDRPGGCADRLLLRRRTGAAAAIGVLAAVVLALIVVPLPWRIDAAAGTARASEASIAAPSFVKGNARKPASRLRVSVQLERTDNGYYEWSQTYDRNLDDLRETQDRIASAVVQQLKESLMSDAAPVAATSRR